MQVFAFMLLVWVFLRLSGLGRRRRFSGAYRMGMWPGRMCVHGRTPRPVDMQTLSAPRVDTSTLQRENAFDLLKKRYVNDQISDEQYEHELDALLRTPEGRAQVQ